jgi:glutathione S-transferase
MTQAAPSGPARLVISSKNYSSWSLRGWLLMRMSGIDFTLERVDPNDSVARAELLNQTSSVRIPYLVHDGLDLPDVMAIAEYLNEIRPQAQMYPADLKARARCRAVSAEMHEGFTSLRAALPVNLRAEPRRVPLWSGVRADIARISEIWTECLKTSGGPFLFGDRMTVADAMYAPVCTRYHTYMVKLEPLCAAYTDIILALPDMQSWTEDAREEPGEVSELELDVEF